MDHDLSQRNASQAVQAVSRLLALAGSAPDPGVLEDALVREAAGFFRAPAALLVAVGRRDRRADVVSATPATPATPAAATALDDVPALAELVDGELRALRLEAPRAAELLHALGAAAPDGPAQLLALADHVLVLAGGRPDAFLGEEGDLATAFADVAAASLSRRRASVAQAERMARQEALTRAAQTLNESLDLETLLGRICTEAATLLDADNASIYQDDEATGLRVAAIYGLPPEFLGSGHEPGTGLAGKVAVSREPVLTNDYRRTAKMAAGSPFARVQAALAVPFDWGDDTFGVLAVGYERPHRVDEEDLAVLETFARLAAVACRNASAHAGLALAAQTDGLTGCLNHAALHQHLARELERAARGAVEPPSLVLIDLDHFKQVNETHGHLTGDEVLRRVGAALRSGVRPYDVAARYGGDEFALVVTAADEEAAAEVASRAVARISAAIAEFVEGAAAGATAGVAAWTSGLRIAELVARADRALLYGKQTEGRAAVHRFTGVPDDWNRGRFGRPGAHGLPARAPLPIVPSGSDASAQEERLRKRSRQLALANALGARLAGMTDPQQILEATVEELHLAFGYFCTAVVRLCDDDHVEAAAMRGEAFLGLGLRGWRQHRDLGLIGRCLRTRRAVLVNDVTAEPGYASTPETADVRAELVAPLLVGNELWGVLNVEDTEPGAFDEDDLRLIETLTDQVGAALRSASLYEQLERAYLGTAEALVNALEAKDAYTADHARSIGEQAEAVGRRLGMSEPELRDLRFAAVFHDIGKIAVPEAILSKPGPLTPEERTIMERHTIVGEQILAPVEFLAGVRRLVRHEHERWDGHGYPDRLAGEEIPLGSRIILACDALHAMTSDRPYRKAMPRAAALDELCRHAGTQFDPRVFDALLGTLRLAPVAARTA